MCKFYLNCNIKNIENLGLKKTFIVKYIRYKDNWISYMHTINKNLLDLSVDHLQIFTIYHNII